MPLQLQLLAQTGPPESRAFQFLYFNRKQIKGVLSCTVEGLEVGLSLSLPSLHKSPKWGPPFFLIPSNIDRASSCQELFVALGTHHEHDRNPQHRWGVRTKAVEGTGSVDMQHSLDHLSLNCKERFPRGADTWVGY